jgi:hypothetical protein
MKFKITVEHVIREEYEMVFEDENIMRAFDKARELVAARNKTVRAGKFFVTKISEVKEE